MLATMYLCRTGLGCVQFGRLGQCSISTSVTRLVDDLSLITPRETDDTVMMERGPQPIITSRKPFMPLGLADMQVSGRRGGDLKLCQRLTGREPLLVSSTQNNNIIHNVFQPPKVNSNGFKWIHYSSVVCQNDIKPNFGRENVGIPTPPYVRAIHARELLTKWIEEKMQLLQADPETRLDWKDIMTKVHDINNTFDYKSFGSVFLGICNSRSDGVYPIAEEYMKWVEKPNISELASFMRLCGMHRDEASEEVIFGLYNTIKTRNHGMWDYHLADSVISGLVTTSKWRECLDIIEAVKLGGDGILRSREKVVCKAFEEKDLELGWKLIETNPIPTNRRLKSPSYEYWFKNCPQTEESVTRVLDYCIENESHPSETAMNHLKLYFDKVLNYDSTPTIIDTTHFICKNCHQPLVKPELSEQEFKTLEETFMKKVLIQEDIFLNTSPHEFKMYSNYIRQHGPFDYVIDGLNLAFSYRPYEKRPNPVALERAVYQFSSQGKRVLVIGRVHMRKWPPSVLNNIAECGYLFLLDNKSEDDPFLIYAALKSGDNCKLISLDFLRNHTFNLQDRAVSKLFRQWRWTHQLKFSWDSTGYLKTAPFAPLPPIPQKNTTTGIYHIPYELHGIVSPYELPSKWMCFTPRK